MKSYFDAILALGSNLGNRRENLVSACSRIERFARILGRSRFYETDPEGYENQPRFLNAALHVRTTASALELLEACQRVEASLGRVRSFRNAPRPIDIDIIFFEDETFDDEFLTIPHPRWNSREFVITPLLDLLEAGAFVQEGIGKWRAEFEDRPRLIPPFGAF